MGDILVSSAYPKQYFDAASRLQGTDKSKTKTSFWKSRPRGKDNTAQEVLTFKFAERSAVTSISFDVLSIGATYSLHYKDSDGRSLPMLKDDLTELKFTTASGKDTSQWQHWSFSLSPCIVTEVELRMQRVADSLAPDGEYSLAIRKLTMSRSIQSREQAALPLHANKDALSNTITKAIKDWGANKVLDGRTDTYWKCEPQVAQDAVVCLYMDIRDEYGEPQFVDAIDIDPVYAGSQVNMYWSMDDSEGERLTPFSDVEYRFVGDTGNTYNADVGMSDMDIEVDAKDIGLDLSKSWSYSTSFTPSTNNGQSLLTIQDGRNDVCLDFSMYSPSFDGTSISGSCAARLTMLCNGKEFSDIRVQSNKPPVDRVTFPVHDNVDSEVRITVGVSHSSKTFAYLCMRVVNKWREDGQNTQRGTISDDTVVKVACIQAEQCTLANGVQNTTTLEPQDGVSLDMSNKEVVVQPNSSFALPMDTAMRPDSANKAIVTVKYRTDAPYLGGASLDDGILLRTWWEGEPNNSVSVLQVRDKGVRTWWLGRPNSSASRLAIKDKVVCTNVFWDPYFADDGAWLPDQFDGSGHAEKAGNKLTIHGIGRCRNLAKPSSYLRPNTTYVFSAIPEFTGKSWYKDYKLFVYDGAKEEYIATPPLEVESGKRCYITFTTPSDTRLLSFGFVGGNGTRSTVNWSKVVVCTMDDWTDLASNGMDWFDVDETGAVQLQRHCNELNINPLNNPNLPLLGELAAPSAFARRTFDGYVTSLSPGDNEYDIPQGDDWIHGTGGSSYSFTFHVASDGSYSNPQPYLVDSNQVKYFPDRYSQTDAGNGWRKVEARVSLPKGHAPDMLHFGIRINEPNSHTYIGNLHVADNMEAFGEWGDWTTATMECPVDGNYVLHNTSNTSCIYIKSASVLYVTGKGTAKSGTMQKPVVHAQCIGNTSNMLLRQAEPPTSQSEDKFVANPDICMSPDNYDSDSSMAGAVLYAKWKDEATVRGGVCDSIYEAKEWTPCFIGERLHKQTYVLPQPVKAKYLKLEFTQLTPVQYPLPYNGIKQAYRTFPSDIQFETDRVYSLQSTSNKHNTVQSTPPRSYARISDKFDAEQSSNPNQLSNAMRGQYWQPDVSVLNGKLPVDYIPGNYETPLTDAIATESTSSVQYTGMAQGEAGNTTNPTLHSISDSAAKYMVYDAYASNDLLAIAREWNIDDWHYDYNASQYSDDWNTRMLQPGMMPNYWLMPGQKLAVSNSTMRQMLSDSKADVVRRGSTLKPQLAVTDSRTNTVGVVGPRGFSRTCKHWYEHLVATRTQSIAYVVGIRELSIRTVNYLSQHDNTAWKLYSMALPIWHIQGGRLTKDDVLVPDFTAGNEVCIATTDPMHSQSYYRAIKVLGTSRRTLANRTWFPLGSTESWHGPDYWYEHPELDCTWADNSPDDPSVAEDNGGAWGSRRYSWGESWVGTVAEHKEWNVWYGNELAKHIQASKVVKDGKQVPLTIQVGEAYIPSLSMTKLGVSLSSLKLCNKDGHKPSVRLQLMSGRYGNELLIDEALDFDDSKLGVWQNLETSRTKLLDMQYKCRVLLQFDDFETLDVYMKAGYLETGTMVVEARNTQKADGSDWVDITSVIGRKDSIYTFGETNNDFQLRITMNDPQDWFSSLIAIPLYVPYEDAIDYHYDGVQSIRIVRDDGSELPTVQVGQSIAIGVECTLNDGTKSDYIRTQDVQWDTSNRDIARVSANGTLSAYAPGSCIVSAKYKGVSTTLEVHTER